MDQNDASQGQKAGSSGGQDDIRSVLMSAIEQHRDPDAGGAQGDQNQEAEAQRARDQQGRFAKGDEAAAAAAAASSATASAAPGADAGRSGAADTGAAQKLEAPHSWKAEAKAHWDTLPAEVQRYVLDRETEVQKGFTKFDEDRAFAKQLRDVINPYMPIIQAEGGNPATAVQQLLNTAYVLRTANPQQKAHLFSQLAQQYGVDLGTLAQGAPRVDPTTAALQQQIAQLQAHVHGQARAAEQQQAATLQAEIAKFSADKPHFETLKPMMAALLQSGQAPDLQTAYGMAFRAHPTTSVEAQRAEAARAEQARAEATRARTQAAQAAAVSVTGAPAGGAGAADQPAASLREELSRQFRKSGRV